jgi:hypothetical protein
MEVCSDCVKAEQTGDWPIFWSDRWCCWARQTSEAVARSGKGYDRAAVQAVLIARVLGRANETEAAAFMARLEELGVEVGDGRA